MEIAQIIILSLSSLLLTMVGISRLSNPVKNYAKNSGIQLSRDVNLLNEMRGVGAVMLCTGLVTLWGVFLPAITRSSFLVGTLIFIGFAIGRFVSIAADGKPGKEISQGIVFEIVLGSANLFGFVITLVGN